MLTDTGPLVAILSPRDQYHDVCVRIVENSQGPLLTCWPVITEAAWLLQKDPSAFERLLERISEGVVEIVPLEAKEASAVAEVMEQYKNIRPQFADAMMVYLAKRDNIETIFTLDRRDFSIYRSGRRKPFRLLPE